VNVSCWLSHLQFDWESPVWRHLLADLGAFSTLVRFDERGSGLSDWQVPDYSIDARVADLETIVDRLGLERFDLLGISQGGPIAITYAVRHPERVSHLVLLGAYSRGSLRRDPSPEHVAEFEAMLSLVRVGWARESPVFRRVFTNIFIPDASDEQVDWFDELQRKSTSSENSGLARALPDLPGDHEAEPRRNEILDRAARACRHALAVACFEEPLEIDEVQAAFSASDHRDDGREPPQGCAQFARGRVGHFRPAVAGGLNRVSNPPISYWAASNGQGRAHLVLPFRDPGCHRSIPTEIRPATYQLGSDAGRSR
jgi:pimeloyl-ACP methyl ester carboxylesterase